MNAILKCKHCKPEPTQPTVAYFGDKMEIYCASLERFCYPGAFVEGKDHKQVVEEWNAIHGYVEEEDES